MCQMRWQKNFLVRWAFFIFFLCRAVVWSGVEVSVRVVVLPLPLTGKVLPKKRAFYNRDFKRNTFRSKNFSLFQTYKFLWKREKFLRIFSLNVQRIPSIPLFWQYNVVGGFFSSTNKTRYIFLEYTWLKKLQQTHLYI